MRNGIQTIGILAGTFTALALGGGEARGQDAAAIAEQAFDEAYVAFAEAYRQADPAGVTRLYAAEAFYLPPGDDIAKGDVARHFEWLSSFDAGAGPIVEFEIVDREITEDLAYDIGYYTIRLSDAPAGSDSRGKFIVIWKRGQDGTWRIHADGFSEVSAPDGEER